MPLKYYRLNLRETCKLMPIIGLIREGKTPADNRVALTPAQCRWLKINVPEISILVQTSPNRCFSDKEYQQAGVTITENMSDCDILLGIKEVPKEQLIPNKTYLFFSHTKKLQPYNQAMLMEMVKKKITLIDYECLEHDDGKRIIGFGFFAGVVGAHNGIMAYGNRTGTFHLEKVNSSKNLQYLIHTYFGLKLPNLRIAVTGSGRVAHGIVEIMNLLEITEVDPEDYLTKIFAYPVYVHLKGGKLYRRKDNGPYQREDFHHHPEQYECLFHKYIGCTDILMNGIYWQKNIQPLFEVADVQNPDFSILTIADITDDMHGSVPINLGDSTIDDPVYGVDRNTLQKTAPYLPNSIDVMAVGNLPNELPKDASRYFGEQLIKYILRDLIEGNSKIIDRARILDKGKLTGLYAYMEDYALGN